VATSTGKYWKYWEVMEKQIATGKYWKKCFFIPSTRKYWEVLDF
jgi:hypothetical protein